MTLTKLPRSSRGQPGESRSNGAFPTSERWVGWKELLFGTKKKSLSFEMIVNGCTCSPCGVTDFMNYLMYVERAAENLQFYMWYRDYIQRFAALSESQWMLSPPWTEDQRRDMIRRNNQAKNDAKFAPSIIGAFVPIPGYPSVTETELDDLTPFATRPSSAHGDYEASSIARGDWLEWEGGAKLLDSQEFLDDSKAFDDVDSLEPFTVQPFRKETNRIIATYLIDGAPRQLNLTSIERKIVLHALTGTTHPSAYAGVLQEIEWNLRQQSHPQFLKWVMNNSNSNRLMCARIVSSLFVFLGVAIAIILVFSKKHRGWRMFSALLLFPGLAALIAAMEGTCMMFLCFYKRQLHPWELYDGDGQGTSCQLNTRAFDAFGSANAYEDEPWARKNQKRGFLSKAFDPTVKIKDPTLCQMQTMTIVRATTLGTAITVILLGIFMTLPSGNYY